MFAHSGWTLRGLKNDNNVRVGIQLIVAVCSVKTWPSHLLIIILLTAKVSPQLHSLYKMQSE